MKFEKDQQVVLLNSGGTWQDVIIINEEGGGFWTIYDGKMDYPVHSDDLAIRKLPELHMTTLSQIAKKHNATTRTVWCWCWKLGINPHYVGESRDPSRKGVIAVLDDEQLDKLQAWLKTKK